MTAVTASGTSPEVFDPWLGAKKWAVSTLTYSFPRDGSSYEYLGTGAVTPLSPDQKAVARKVLDEIAGFTGLSFVEVTESPLVQGDLRFAIDPLEDGAYAYLPSGQERGGDAFFGPITANPVAGNESYLYFLHEIGHTMGLNHGHQFRKFRDSGLDSQEFTVMTYTDYVGDTSDTYDSGPVDWGQSFMQLDIAAMQFLYGANYAPSGQAWSGDTIYGFNPDTGEMSINGAGQGIPAGNRIFRTIWDGDGNDTYDLSAYSTDLQIDLGAGGWSVFSADQLADLNRNDASPIYDARGNLANALLVDGDQRALIENAIGGAGADTLLGNQGENRLQGNGGNDTLRGLDGADRLIGNGGRDLLRGNGGDDTLIGNTGRDRLLGDRGGDTLKGGGGNDRLFGGKGNDRLKGQGGDDALTGNRGRDIMTGGAGDDRFVFRAASDSPVGAGSDRITDFTSGTDTLDLSRLVAGTFTLSLGGAFSATGPSVITRLENGNTRVLVDMDGDSNADFRVILEGTSLIGVNDFVL